MYAITLNTKGQMLSSKAYFQAEFFKTLYIIQDAYLLQSAMCKYINICQNGLYAAS